MRARQPAYFLLVTLGLALTATAATAQTHLGSIRGTVADPSGAAVADAPLTLMHEETGLTRTVSTGSAGTFSVSQLAPGAYRMEVELAGYKNVCEPHNTAGQPAPPPRRGPRDRRGDGGSLRHGVGCTRARFGRVEHDRRQPADYELAARRAEFSRALAAGARRVPCCAGLGRVSAGRLQLQRQRRARGYERVPPRRCLQQRPQAQHGWSPPAGGRHRGVSTPDEHI